MKRIVLTLTLMIVFIGMLGISTNVHKVEAPYPIIFIRADGSIYPLPANITSSDNVTYTFTDNINASIVVEKDNIIVDGAGYTLQGPGSGTGIDLTGRSNVTIKNMTIKGFYQGILLYSYSSNNTISGNAITNNEFGIYFDSSSNNTISGNNITNNMDGIWLYKSSNNSISGNNITNNDYTGIYLEGPSSNNIISGNSITENNGYGIMLEYSSNNTISWNNITANQEGIRLYRSSNNLLHGNTIKNNADGIVLWISCSNNRIYQSNIANNTHCNVWIQESSENVIAGNKIVDSEWGIGFDYSSNNKVYHNYFAANDRQVVRIHSYINIWDNGYPSGGNYWSNYTGVDLDHDGIGDSPHVLDGNNTDNFPLMGMFHSFNASLGYYANVISNSTIEDFTFFESNSTIRMYVSNSSATQSFGFCRVSIPKGLMSPPYTVIIDDGLTEVLYFNGTVYENDTHLWIYFAYEHSTCKVDIIPEFPTWTSMLLILILLTFATVIIKRRLLKTPIH